MPAAKVNRGRAVTKFSPELVQKVFDKVSLGKTLREVSKEQGMPTPSTIYKWIREDPELHKQWQVVKEMKSHALFEHSLDLAQNLANLIEKKDHVLGLNQIKAAAIALQAFQDAAAKLNPQDYGQRRAGQVVVPIQIVTNMNMGQEGKPAAEEGSSIYEITVPYQITTDVPSQ